MSAKNMSFLSHLEELRWHFFRVIVVLLLATILLFVFQEKIYQHIILVHLQPDALSYQFFCRLFSFFGGESTFCNLHFSNKLQSLGFTDQFTNALWTSFVFGFIVSFPYIIWEFWRFIAPGLSTNELKKSKQYLFFASFFFLLGMLFAYFVIIPLSVYFFYDYQITDAIENRFTLASYVSLVTHTLLWIGLAFELPLLIIFIAKLGLISVQTLKKYRSYAVVLILLLSAVLTPPDPGSQIIVAIPLMLLYEMGIWGAKMVEKRTAYNS